MIFAFGVVLLLWAMSHMGKNQHNLALNAKNSEIVFSQWD